MSTHVQSQLQNFFNLQIPTLLLMIPIILFVVIGVPTGLLDFTPDGEKIVHSHFFSTWLVDNYNVHLDKEMLTVLVMEVDAATTMAKLSLEKGFADAEKVLAEIRRRVRAP